MTDGRNRATDLLRAAKADPSTVDLDAVAVLLEADAGTDRNSALKVFAAVAHAEPDRAAERIDLVADRLDDSHLVARCTAAMVLAQVAEERPATVEPAVPTLIGLLDEEPPLLRFRAARALAPVATVRPAAFVDHADVLVDVLDDGPVVDHDAPDDEFERATLGTNRSRGEAAGKDRRRSRRTREAAANLLVEVARESPDALYDRRPALVTLLSDDDEAVRAAVVEAFRHLAEADPDAAAPAVDRLIDLLGDDAEVVRARAVRALGYAEATGAIPALGALAESGDEEVPATAADTAEWLRDKR
ncbi:hypothetical protein BRD03_13720 [Halobacteriales archaeon QS_9_68_17]|nr:MAG: hypothetical protein BRD03_13720 [Halobacteriales archaeon QS_9_68_17]